MLQKYPEAKRSLWIRQLGDAHLPSPEAGIIFKVCRCRSILAPQLIAPDRPLEIAWIFQNTQHSRSLTWIKQRFYLLFGQLVLDVAKQMHNGVVCKCDDVGITVEYAVSSFFVSLPSTKR